LNESAHANHKVITGGRKRQSRDIRFERDMVQDDPAREVSKNCLTILVDGEKQAATRVEGDARNILAMREWKGI